MDTPFAEETQITSAPGIIIVANSSGELVYNQKSWQGHTFENVTLHNATLCRIGKESLDDCEDFCGLALQHETIRGIVIADGVSQSYAGKQIASYTTHQLLEMICNYKDNNFDGSIAHQWIEKVCTNSPFTIKRMTAGLEERIKNRMERRIRNDDLIGSTTFLASLPQEDALHYFGIGNCQGIVTPSGDIIGINYEEPHPQLALRPDGSFDPWQADLFYGKIAGAHGGWFVTDGCIKEKTIEELASYLDPCNPENTFKESIRYSERQELIDDAVMVHFQ